MGKRDDSGLRILLQIIFYNMLRTKTLGPKPGTSFVALFCYVVQPSPQFTPA